MRKRVVGMFLFLSMAFPFPMSSAMAETLYREDFGSPGTLEELGFAEMTNFGKDEANGHAVAGIGGDPAGTVSHFTKTVSGKKEKTAPLAVQWRVNLQTDVAFGPGEMEHLFSVHGDPDFLGSAEYTLSLMSARDGLGPFVSMELKNRPGGDVLAIGRLDGSLPGFSWVTFRMEFHPAAGGFEEIKLLVDLGDGNGLVEKLSAAGGGYVSASLLDYPLMNLRFIFTHLPSTAIFFDDLKVVGGGDSVPETGTATYFYDALERLDNRSFAPGGFPPEIGFVYDDNGNRVQRAVLGF
ncbi:MAG: hypothetical protein ACLFN9_12830 [Desulfococcaceae bacterium]